MEAPVNKLKCLILVLFFLVGGGNLYLTGDEEEEEIPILKIVGIIEEYHRTMKDMKSLGETISDYVDYHRKAPEVKTLKELLQMDCGNGLTFLEFFFDDVAEEKVPLKDFWGNDFLYQYQDHRFWIASAGSDGEFKGFEQTGVYPLQDSYLRGKDIILSNNGFTVFPLGQEEADFLILVLLAAYSSLSINN